MSKASAWGAPDQELTKLVREQFEASLDVYRRDPNYIREHVNQEDSFRTGGYAERQLFELIQNAADANQRGSGSGRVEVRLSGSTLYCANEGAGFDAAGVIALTHAFLSEKRGDEIGRFGLGFKSVLSVTDRPQVLSRTISFEFSSPEAERALVSLGADKSAIPRLRVPTIVDPNSVFDTDPVAASLAKWATTIVRLPNLEHRDRILAQMSSFQTEFLLFAESVSALDLVIDDEAEGQSRRHACIDDGAGQYTIRAADGEESQWIVRSRMHRPSPQAKKEVGDAIARDEIKVTYAAPIRLGSGLGRFWSYFPLQNETTANGMFNAPWRVNDDRTTMLKGKYNDEVLELMSEMFVEVLPLLSLPEDPARHFDYMPGRGREARSDGDAYLSRRIPELAADLPLIPDGLGKLRLAADLKLVALKYRVPYEAIAQWASAPGADPDFMHFRCFTSPERRSRLARFLDADEEESKGDAVGAGVAEWLSILGSSKDLASCVIALSIVAGLKDNTLQAKARESTIIPSVSGVVYKANATSVVFLAPEAGVDVGDFDFIDPAFVGAAGVESTLRSLGFRILDPYQVFRALLRRASEEYDDAWWERLWDARLDVPNDQVRDLLLDQLRDSRLLKMKAKDGIWRETHKLVFLESEGIELGEPRLELDADAHERDVSILRAAGITCGVDPRYPIREEPIFQDYRTWANDLYQKKLARSSSATTGAAAFLQERGPGPVGLLAVFTAENQMDAVAKWTRLLLRCEADPTWTLARPNGSNAEQFQAPHLWAIREYGLVPTSWGPRRPFTAVDPSLLEFLDYLPVATERNASGLDLPDSVESVPAVIWQEYLGRDANGSDPDLLGRMVVEALRQLPEPFEIETLPARVGQATRAVPSDTVTIASTEEECRVLEAKSMPYVWIADDADAQEVAERTGAGLAHDQITFAVITEGVSESTPILDRFGALRGLGDPKLRNAQMVECERISKRVSTPDGVEDEPVEFLLQGSTIYLLRAIGSEAQLAYVNRSFGLGLGDAERSRMLEEAVVAEQQLLMEKCRAEGDDAKRLLLLFTPAELGSRLPKDLLRAIKRMGGKTADSDIARIFLDVFGKDAILQLKDDFVKKGFPSIDRWAGSSSAQRFVSSIGFDSSFAGQSGSALEPTIQVPGKPGLPPLHGYQEELAVKMNEILTSPRGKAAKAMVFLPTGAGKTRVTVETVIRAFLEDTIAGPVVWIAQSEELCEQAVQTWSTVWREFGDTRTMEINRLWSTNSVGPSSADISIVVATDAKLDSIINRGDHLVEYRWLQDASAVIVDEAHVAGDAPSYTRIFQWLGVDGRSNERPLLGLSATTYKGVSEKRTASLVSRFGNNRLNSLGEDPYGALQEMKVLAKVTHHILKGATVDLTAKEQEEASGFNRLNATVLERIGRDEERTVGIIKHIQSLPEDWPVLVFTSSVLSAQVLAALLQSQKISAASVSGETRRPERRRIIEEFKDGKIRVLTNCDVLSQGFDAPGVRALYIARPTFSPNSYVQMVGRGLRGPLNGGKEECLIVNLADTFSNFKGELAFKQFDYLWDTGAGRTK